MTVPLSLSFLLIQATELFCCHASRFFVPVWLDHLSSIHFLNQRTSHLALLAKRTSQAYNHPQNLHAYILPDESPQSHLLQIPNLR